MDAVVDRIWSQLLRIDAEVALQTLAKVLDNAARHPGEVKYRVLRKNNARVTDRLPCEECFEVLRICGFLEVAEAVVLPEDSNVDHLLVARDILLRALATGPPLKNGTTSARMAAVDASTSESSMAASTFVGSSISRAGVATHRKLTVLFMQMSLEVDVAACQGSLEGFQRQLCEMTSVPRERQQLSIEGQVLSVMTSWHIILYSTAPITLVDLDAEPRHGIAGTLPESERQIAPAVSSATPPGVHPESRPDEAPEAAAEAALETLPETSPAVSSEALPEALPEPLKEASPQAAQEPSTAAACPEAAAEASPEVDAGGVSAVPPKYFVCGSWTGWAFQELQAHHLDGTVRCIAGVEADCQAAFQIVQNQDWNQRYHPRLVMPNMQPPPGGAEFCLYGDPAVEHPAVPGVADGPGPEGHDINWLIKSVGANARFTVIFDPRVPSVRWSPYYDEQDRASIRRLSALGLNPAAAVRAYAIAGRNEGLATEMAGTFLFEGSDPLSFALSS